MAQSRRTVAMLDPEPVVWRWRPGEDLMLPQSKSVRFGGTLQCGPRDPPGSPTVSIRAEAPFDAPPPDRPGLRRNDTLGRTCKTMNNWAILVVMGITTWLVVIGLVVVLWRLLRSKSVEPEGRRRQEHPEPRGRTPLDAEPTANSPDGASLAPDAVLNGREAHVHPPDWPKYPRDGKTT